MQRYIISLSNQVHHRCKIHRALEKIEDGSYGYCGISGDPIGLQRLLLRPTAELSFEEKARQEELERSYTKRRG